MKTKAKQTKKAQTLAPEPGTYCIFRCTGAGVHAGILVSRNHDEARIRDSRRLWHWWSRFTLSALALEGPRADKIGECQFAAAIPHEIDLIGVCEVIPCTPVAEAGVRAVPEHNR